ncbi:hypothetical protein [Helicobacter mehlei]|uniref:Uncharacterized protein n=1 Tax=Helicobacter mehlei TaxID=2316080 RepID=A0A553V3J5_9HELI|nr:hypothetical protein [Helicobacter mehlei]TSA86954.1 hypothetical protein FNE76_00340 [Helicobacter mehlei]
MAGVSSIKHAPLSAPKITPVPPKPSTPLKPTTTEVEIKTNQLATATKNTNHTIGALQVALKSIDQMQPLAQDLANLATPKNTQGNTLKEQIQKIYDQALYQGENVFTKSYENPNLQFKSIKPDRLLVGDPSTSKAFVKTLEEQKIALSDALKKMTPPNPKEDFSTLDPDQLKGLDKAHNPQALKAQKVQDLLHT